MFCLPPEIVKNIDTIDTNLSNLHALLLSLWTPAQRSLSGLSATAELLVPEIWLADIRYRNSDAEKFKISRVTGVTSDTDGKGQGHAVRITVSVD